jgi:hypothetical protein
MNHADALDIEARIIALEMLVIPLAAAKRDLAEALIASMEQAPENWPPADIDATELDFGERVLERRRKYAEEMRSMLEAAAES